MPEVDEIFDAEGNLLDPDLVDDGSLVYDAEGNEYAFDVIEVEPELELAGVGKADIPGALRSFRAGASRFGAGALDTAKKNKKLLAFGAGSAAVGAGSAAGGALAGYGAAKVGKSESLGDSVRGALSKALTDEDRNAVITKALDEVDSIRAEAAEATSIAKALQDERDMEHFISKADSYGLPAPAEQLGSILKALAESPDVSDEDLDLIDAVLSAAGEVLRSELGGTGSGSNSEVMAIVDGYADELVGKSAGGISKADGVVAMFDANPEAYDDYLNEMGR